MSSKKLLVLGLGSLALITCSMNLAKINTYADENEESFGIYAQAKKKITLKIFDKSKNNGEEFEEIDLGEIDDLGVDPKSYYANENIRNKINENRVIVTQLRINDDNAGYTIWGERAGNLTIKDPATDTEQIIPYTVNTPSTQNIQTISYTLPQIDSDEYYYERVKENGETEVIEYEEDNATFILTDEARLRDTILTKYSSGQEGLAKILKPTKKILTRYEGDIPVANNFSKELLSCLDFGSKQNKINKEMISISQEAKNNLAQYAILGEHNIDILVYFTDKSYASFTITVNVIPRPDNKNNNSDTSNDGNTNTNTAPDNNAANSNTNTTPSNNTASGNTNNNNSTINNSSARNFSRGSSSSSGGSNKANIRVKKVAISSNLPNYVINGGTWSNNNGVWKYKKENKEYKDSWAAIENPFANEKLGQARFSWFRFDKDGNMLTNWQWIKDEKDGLLKCYYLNPHSDGSLGAMFFNTTTPDGYTVNANGEWVVNGVVQTK